MCTNTYVYLLQYCLCTYTPATVLLVYLHTCYSTACVPTHLLQYCLCICAPATVLLVYLRTCYSTACTRVSSGPASQQRLWTGNAVQEVQLYRKSSCIGSPAVQEVRLYSTRIYIHTHVLYIEYFL
jgi:hypothetical protein